MKDTNVESVCKKYSNIYGSDLSDDFLYYSLGKKAQPFLYHLLFTDDSK